MKGVSQLRYLGQKNNNEINTIFGYSHILVNTSQYEGFSNTFIQAWMRGVPVVSLNTDPDGLIESKRLGYFCNGSYDKLKNSVYELVINDELREQLSIQSKEFSLKSFSMHNLDRVAYHISHNVV